MKWEKKAKFYADKSIEELQAIIKSAITEDVKKAIMDLDESLTDEVKLRDVLIDFSIWN